ncbi:MAG: AAA family ATPase [Planktothrix rubescens PR222]
MHLLRVQVPNFRALNQVDITFEEDFFPRIFPLGSQNGGGKSTLLQLIFTLLHCSSGERVIFLRNLLYRFNPNQSSEKNILAIFDIWDGSKTHTIEFFSEKKFDAIFFKDYNEKLPSSIPSKTKGSLSLPLERIRRLINEPEWENNLLLICLYCSPKNPLSEGKLLLCKIENLSSNEARIFLDKLSRKVFLASHITQDFLFMSGEYRKLFSEKKDDSEKNDCSNINSLKTKIPGFFTYDFLAIDLVNQLFIDARNKDRNAIKDGEDSNYHETLLKQDINSILINKKINFSPDLNQITFKLDKQGQEVDLYPEDLSRGELKRLSIYVWLKYNEIKDAIVLMDEIEITLHPDWQYQIISDLQQWERSNQYILASHSYDLCEALTPAHVKEIEPKLIKNQN